jgi:hypothetical protein
MVVDALGALAKIKAFAGFAHKRKVQYDLEGRLNDYVRGVRKEAPYLAGARVKVQWTERSLTKKGFFEDGKVILRLKRDDPQDTNFVHGAYWAVSTGFLFKAKRYVSKPQREAVDLYVTTKVLEREKPSVRGIFLDKYLHPKTKEPHSKVSAYFDDFMAIDKGGYFYPVFLQELDYLGEKVFGRRQDHKIVQEVNGIIAHLKKVAQRKIGEEGDLKFVGHYCRAAIVIVGKSWNLSPGGEAYVNFVRGQLIPERIETLYMHGRHENKDVIDSACAALSDNFERCATRTYNTVLRYGKTEVPSKQYLAVLRRKGVSVFQSSE